MSEIFFLAEIHSWFVHWNSLRNSFFCATFSWSFGTPFEPQCHIIWEYWSNAKRICPIHNGNNYSNLTWNWPINLIALKWKWPKWFNDISELIKFNSDEKGRNSEYFQRWSFLQMKSIDILVWHGVLGAIVLHPNLRRRKND